MYYIDSMKRKTISVRVSVDTWKRLEKRARSLGRSRSEVLRLALEEYLETGGSEADRPIDRVRDLIASARSGVPDLGERHREHLIENLRGSA